MTQVTRDAVTDFKTFDTNSDGHISEDEVDVYQNERMEAFGKGKVDNIEQNYIRELIKGLRKDGKLTQDDFNLVADTMNDAEYYTIGRTKGGSLPANMNPTIDWTGNPETDMPNGKRISLEEAEDYLKFCLKGKNLSDAEKLYLFNRLKDLKASDSDGMVDSVAVSNLRHHYIPVFEAQDVFGSEDTECT